MTPEQEHSFYTTRVGHKAAGQGFYVVNTLGTDGKVYRILSDRFPDHRAAEQEAARILARIGIEGVMSAGIGEKEKTTPLLLLPRVRTDLSEFSIPTASGTFRVEAATQQEAEEKISRFHELWVEAGFGKLTPSHPTSLPSDQSGQAKPMPETFTIGRSNRRRSLLDRILGRAPYEYGFALTSDQWVYGEVKAGSFEKAELEGQAKLLDMALPRSRRSRGILRWLKK